jgi:glutamate racemase
MGKEKSIGLFDSGVGGLTVANEVFAMLPQENIIYLGDTARTPYGPRPLEEVKGFAFQITDFLVSHGVKMIVVACNTATSAALSHLKEAYDIPIIGVVDPGAHAAVATTKKGRVGVIATQGTVDSGAYVNAINRIMGDVKVYQKACPRFVELVESGESESDTALEVAREYLEPLKASDIDTLILGCTHYPFLRGVISQVMGPDVSLIFPAREIALQVKDILREQDLLNEGTGSPYHRFFVTKNSEGFLKIGERFFGRCIPNLEEVSLKDDPRGINAANG